MKQDKSIYNQNPFSGYGSIKICQTLTKAILNENEVRLLFERSKYLFDNQNDRLSFNARGLATWIYQCSRKYNKITKKLFKGELRSSWANAAISKIDEFNSQELANSIYAFGKLGIKPSQEFIDAWTNAAISKIDEFNSQGLANNIYAFSILGIEPSNKFIYAWTNAAISKIDEFNSQGLANSIYAFSILGIEPSNKFIDAWTNAAISKIDEFNSQELANSIYAFTLLYQSSSVNLEVFRIVTKEINYLNLDSSPIEQKSQLHTVNKILEQYNPNLLSHKTKETIKAWENYLAQNKSSSSRLHQDVSRILNTLGINHKNEVWDENAATYIDIVPLKQKVAIQVDGPSHYYYNTNIQTSTTSLNTWLLEKLSDYQVIRISYKDWDKLKTDAQKVSYLQQVLPKTQEHAANTNVETVQKNLDNIQKKGKEKVIDNKIEEPSIEKQQVAQAIIKHNVDDKVKRRRHRHHRKRKDEIDNAKTYTTNVEPVIEDYNRLSTCLSVLGTASIISFPIIASSYMMFSGEIATLVSGVSVSAISLAILYKESLPAVINTPLEYIYNTTHSLTERLMQGSSSARGLQ